MLFKCSTAITIKAFVFIEPEMIIASERTFTTREYISRLSIDVMRSGHKI